MNKLVLLVGVTLAASMISGCSQTRSVPSAERPVQLIQADRLMARGQQSFQQGQLYSAARQYRRAEATYAAFDQREYAEMARLNLAKVWYQQGMADSAYLARACALLWPTANAKDASEGQCQPALHWHSVQQAYPDFTPQTAALTVRILYQLPDMAHQAQSLLDSMPARLMETRLTRLWVHQDQLHEADVRTQFEQDLQTAMVMTLNEQGQHSSGYARLQRYQARLYMVDGEYQGAADRLQQALTTYRDGYQRVGMALTLRELAQVYETLGDNEQALSYHVRADRVWASASLSPGG